MTVLEELASLAAERTEQEKRQFSKAQARRLAESLPSGGFRFERALQKPGLSFICECKKASPSRGMIAEDFPWLRIARDYEEGGADAVSVLTEPVKFLGQDRYLEEIASQVHIPCLRKDFTVDEYMIYRARILGASAVLLICSILDGPRLREYREICDSLGMSALVEVHDSGEIGMALDAGARVIGVNNRNLKDFSVDPGNSARLRSLVPESVLFVSESGVRDASDISGIRKTGADAVLIGEALMRAADRKAKLREFREAV